MNVTIHPYTPADLYHVMTVWNSIIAEGDAFLEETPLSSDEMGAFLDTFRSVYCAKIGTEVAGIYLLRKLNSGKGSHIGEVIYAVKFSFRNLGVGTKMCEHSVKTAHDLGFSAIVGTRVPGMNAGAMNFLTKCGFVPAGEVPRGYRSTRTVLVDPVSSPVEEPKKGLLGKLFEKNPAPASPPAQIETTVVEYFSLYSYLKEV